MDELILTNVFRAIEILLLALGSMIWWHVRRSDGHLEMVANEVAKMREQQVRSDTITERIERDLDGLRLRMDRGDMRLTKIEQQVTVLGERLHASTGN